MAALRAVALGMAVNTWCLCYPCSVGLGPEPKPLLRNVPMPRSRYPNPKGLAMNPKDPRRLIVEGIPRIQQETLIG